MNIAIVFASDAAVYVEPHKVCYHFSVLKRGGVSHNFEIIDEDQPV